MQPQACFQDVLPPHPPPPLSLAFPCTSPGRRVTFPPETPPSSLPELLNSPLSLAPSGWAPRHLGLFQTRRWGWEEGGAAGTRPAKSPRDFGISYSGFSKEVWAPSPLLSQTQESGPQSPHPPSTPPLQVPAVALSPLLGASLGTEALRCSLLPILYRDPSSPPPPSRLRPKLSHRKLWGPESPPPPSSAPPWTGGSRLKPCFLHTDPHSLELQFGGRCPSHCVPIAAHPASPTSSLCSFCLSVVVSLKTKISPQ